MGKIIILIYIFCLTVFANVFEVSKDSVQINLIKNSYIYFDKSAKEPFKIILEKKDKFKKFEKDKLDKGITTSSVWINLKLKNKENYPISKTIYINRPLANALTIYKKTANTYEKKVFREFENFEQIINLSYDIELQKKEEVEFFINFNSTISSLNFDLILTNKSEVYKKEIPRQLMLTLFFGSIITFIFYNLFIYIFTKEKAYLYYVGYFTTLIIYYSYNTGMYIHLYYEFFEYKAIYLLCFLVLFVLLFTRSFLNIQEYKKLNISFKILIGIVILIFLITSKDFYPIKAVVIIFVLMVIYAIGLSYYFTFKGHEQAKYLTIGWSIAVLGYLMFAFSYFSLPSLVDYIPYFYESTIFFEAMFFSIALSSRLNKTRALEESVKRNKVLTRELHHRIKNNMQFIISMYRLKLSSHIDEKMNLKIKEIESTIQAMNKIHDMLYAQDDLDSINTKIYFDSLIKQLKQTFNFKNIDIKYSIQTNLDISQSIFCGIILNELVTNALKHAFEDKGIIKVELKKEKNRTLFKVSDNGKGFNQNQIEDNSFGLLLIKSLVTNDLKGDIKVDSNNKTEVTIRF